jgi:predicted 3-demethylubiquinone-9 3-methyltransferase (glyoxalase superfamily)
MPNITPFLWFDREAEAAAEFYVSVFPNSRIVEVSRYPETGPTPGAVMMVEFELDGKPFVALNAGPHFKFTEAISFVIHCRDQAEVDHYWDSLISGGGQESQCGWLKDRYGLSWQVTPDRLLELNKSPDRAKAARVMAAMMQMRRIDIAALERAAAG